MSRYMFAWVDTLMSIVPFLKPFLGKLRILRPVPLFLVKVESKGSRFKISKDWSEAQKQVNQSRESKLTIHIIIYEQHNNNNNNNNDNNNNRNSNYEYNNEENDKDGDDN